MNSKFFVSNLNSSGGGGGNTTTAPAAQSTLISSSGSSSISAIQNKPLNATKSVPATKTVHQSSLERLNSHRQSSAPYCTGGSNAPKRNCLMTLNATLSLDSLVHSSRKLSLIECGNTYGLFILMSNNNNNAATTASSAGAGSAATVNATLFNSEITNQLASSSFTTTTSVTSTSTTTPAAQAQTQTQAHSSSTAVADLLSLGSFATEINNSNSNNGHNNHLHHQPTPSLLLLSSSSSSASLRSTKSTTSSSFFNSNQPGLDKILPIDSRFSYEIVTGSLIETDVTLRVIYGGGSVGGGIGADNGNGTSGRLAPQHNAPSSSSSPISWLAPVDSSAVVSSSIVSPSLPNRHSPSLISLSQSSGTALSSLSSSSSSKPISNSSFHVNASSATSTTTTTSDQRHLRAAPPPLSTSPTTSFCALDLGDQNLLAPFDAKPNQPGSEQLCYTFLLECNDETKQFLALLQSAAQSYPCKRSSLQSSTPGSSLNFDWIVEDYLELAHQLDPTSNPILPDSFLAWFNSVQLSSSLPSSSVAITSPALSHPNSNHNYPTNYAHSPPHPQPSPMALNRNNSLIAFDDNDINLSDNFSRSNSNSNNNQISDLSYKSPFDLANSVYAAIDSLEYFNLASSQDFQSNGEWSAREQCICSLTEDRQSEYVRLEKYRLFVGTWNVNGRMSYENELMAKDFLACDDLPPDFYAIGFQEIDLSKEAFLFNDNKKGELWYNLCSRSLHPGREYIFLKHIRLIGMMILIFVSKELAPFVRNIDAETVGTGILGKMGNKGGVAIRFDLFDTSLCFVNCHLAAHMEQVDRRNQDFREINNRMLFMRCKPPKRISDHDQVYWFGDLNYRVKNIPSELIKTVLKSAKYNSLLDKDQLLEQMSLGNCFQGYTEGKIDFKPSYKYDLNSNDWDSSEKGRPPAWCDRVLYRGNGMQLKKYRCHYELKASDHKPVSALFESQFRVVDEAKRRKVYEDVMKQLDKYENDFLPQVSIDKTEINFGTVLFKDNVSRTLTLANTGQSKVIFNFIPKPNDPSFCKEWLRVTPYSSSIDVKQKVEIRFELNFDHPNIASKLNYGIETLTDTLVLSLFGGKDIFITVLGEYKPSCFGCSLETLVRLPQPVEEITVKELKEKFYKQHYSFNPSRNKALAFQRLISTTTANNTAPDPFKPNQSNLELLLSLDNGVNSTIPINNNNSVAQTKKDLQILPLPKELFAIVDFLYRFGLFEKDLFHSSAVDTEFLDVRDALNGSNPKSIARESIFAVGEALLLFFQTLPEPVIPYAFYRNVIDNRNNFSNCKQVVNELPETHRRVFEYIISFLKELCKFSSQNRFDTRVAAKIFGPYLIRKPENGEVPPSSSNSSSNNMLDLITTTEPETVDFSPNLGPNNGSGYRHQLTLTPEQTFVYLFLNNDAH